MKRCRFYYKYAYVYEYCVKIIMFCYVQCIHTEGSQSIGLNVNHRLFMPLIYTVFRIKIWEYAREKFVVDLVFVFDCLTYILTVCLELYFKINTIHSIIDLRLHTYVSRLQCTFRKQYITFKSLINLTR